MLECVAAHVHWEALIFTNSAARRLSALRQSRQRGFGGRSIKGVRVEILKALNDAALCCLNIRGTHRRKALKFVLNEALAGLRHVLQDLLLNRLRSGFKRDDYIAVWNFPQQLLDRSIIYERKFAEVE